ncbi:hypothetical protein U0070_025640 [Myodes glareolus]|uniref:Uncharacterized protein n=1 Tax=Myodes glareolus TaxID=447135 RepID=A0AAW0I3R6_MYOGA
MGGTASTRRVTFEADENENITVVKGIGFQKMDLERERAAAKEQLTRAIFRERISSEEAWQLEEKDRVIRKQDAFYKEQLARLEERSSEFYKVTTEEYQKAAEEEEPSSSGMNIIQSADLQTKILQCYRQNTQQLLWPARTCTVSIMPNRACWRMEDKVIPKNMQRFFNVYSRGGTFFLFLVRKWPN